MQGNNVSSCSLIVECRRVVLTFHTCSTLLFVCWPHSHHVATLSASRDAQTEGSTRERRLSRKRCRPWCSDRGFQRTTDCSASCWQNIQHSESRCRLKKMLVLDWREQTKIATCMWACLAFSNILSCSPGSTSFYHCLHVGSVSGSLTAPPSATFSRIVLIGPKDWVSCAGVPNSWTLNPRDEVPVFWGLFSQCCRQPAGIKTNLTRFQQWNS